MADYFTRAQAESILPHVAPVLRAIQRLRRDQRAHDDVLAADRAKVLGNGHLPPEKLRQHQTASMTAEEQIAQLSQAVAELGIVIKDLDIGLVDFPALRDGREVYLCWQLGEPHVAWWHEISTGFAGRIPLGDDD